MPKPKRVLAYVATRPSDRHPTKYSVTVARGEVVSPSSYQAVADLAFERHPAAMQVLVSPAPGTKGKPQTFLRQCPNNPYAKRLDSNGITWS